MSPFSMRDFLRWAFGGEKKKKSAFASEQEAYDFCLTVYRQTGGVTPELRRAYQFYQQNYHDDCPPAAGFPQR